MVTPPPVDDDNDEDYDFGLVSGKASIGLAGGRAMQSRTPAVIRIYIALYSIRKFDIISCIDLSLYNET